MKTPVVGMLTTAGIPTTARDHNNGRNPRNVNGSNNIANCRATSIVEATGASWATTSNKDVSNNSMEPIMAVSSNFAFRRPDVVLFLKFN